MVMTLKRALLQQDHRQTIIRTLLQAAIQRNGVLLPSADITAAVKLTTVKFGLVMEEIATNTVVAIARRHVRRI